MKKICFIFFIISVFTAKVTAQSFSLQNLNNNLQAPVGFIAIEGTVEVVNNSGSDKYVKMFRKINNIVPGQTSHFCWGINCYGTTTDTSTYVDTIVSGVSELARADLDPYVAGYSEVTYCWYDINNPADSICLKFTYDITTGINELTTALTDFVSLPHPNPADLSTALVYYLKNHDADSRVVIYNVIGSKVLEVKLDNSKHDVQLNTSSFQPGVYYYSLLSGSKVISTNKLIISHKN